MESIPWVRCASGNVSNGFLQSNHCHCMNGLWLTIDINGLSMVLGKVNAGSQKRPKRKKTWFFQQNHRRKQTLDRLTWPYVIKVSLGNHFSSILALWLPPWNIYKFSYSPLPLNEWLENHHWYQWFYDGFWSPKPLVAMVFQWFLVQKPLAPMVFSIVFGPKTIGTNGFSMVL